MAKQKREPIQGLGKGGFFVAPPVQQPTVEEEEQDTGIQVEQPIGTSQKQDAILPLEQLDVQPSELSKTSPEDRQTVSTIEHPSIAPLDHQNTTTSLQQEISPLQQASVVPADHLSDQQLTSIPEEHFASTPGNTHGEQSPVAPSHHLDVSTLENVNSGASEMSSGETVQQSASLPATFSTNERAKTKITVEIFDDQNDALEMIRLQRLQAWRKQGIKIDKRRYDKSVILQEIVDDWLNRNKR